MSEITSHNIACIGAGQMAEALIGGLLGAQIVDAACLCATDPSEARQGLIKQRFGIHARQNR